MNKFAFVLICLVLFYSVLGKEEGIFHFFDDLAIGFYIDENNLGHLPNLTSFYYSEIPDFLDKDLQTVKNF